MWVLPCISLTDPEKVSKSWSFIPNTRRSIEDDSADPTETYASSNNWPLHCIHKSRNETEYCSHISSNSSSLRNWETFSQADLKVMPCCNPCWHCFIFDTTSVFTLSSRLTVIKESQYLFLGKLHVPAFPTVGINQVLRGGALSYDDTQPPEDDISQPWKRFALRVCFLVTLTKVVHQLLHASDGLQVVGSSCPMMRNIPSSTAAAWVGGLWAGRGFSFL